MHQEILRSICIPPATTIKQTIQKFNETGQKILLVVDGDHALIGTVTDGDIRRGLLHGFGFAESVESIMCRDYITLDYTDSNVKAQARALMIERNISAMPLIDQHQRVRDVIQLTDLLGAKEAQKIHQVYDNEVVIMAGGKGSRLDIFTKIFPKPLIPVGDKTAIEFIMERFYQHGFHKFLYTLNYKKEYVKLFLKEKQFPDDYKIDWVEEQDFLGTAGSISLLNHRIKDTFFVVNCDTLLDANYSEVLAWHKESGAALTVIGCHNEYNIPFGVVRMSDGKLDKIHEKPAHDVIINTGMYVMEPRIFAYLSPGQSIDMNELINRVAEKEDVNVFPVYGRNWLDLGRWDAYTQSTKILEDNGYV